MGTVICRSKLLLPGGERVGRLRLSAVNINAQLANRSRLFHISIAMFLVALFFLYKRGGHHFQVGGAAFRGELQETETLYCQRRARAENAAGYFSREHRATGDDGRREADGVRHQSAGRAHDRAD